MADSPRILPFMIWSKKGVNTGKLIHGKIHEIEFKGRSFLFSWGWPQENGVNRYGLAIGYRVAPRTIGEKAGDEIQIEVVPKADRQEIEALVKNRLASMKIEHVEFFG